MSRDLTPNSLLSILHFNIYMGPEEQKNEQRNEREVELGTCSVCVYSAYWTDRQKDGLWAWQPSVHPFPDSSCLIFKLSCIDLDLIRMSM